MVSPTSSNASPPALGVGLPARVGGAEQRPKATVYGGGAAVNAGDALKVRYGDKVREAAI